MPLTRSVQFDVENIAFSEAEWVPSRHRGRAVAECKQMYEALVSEYGAVRHWEARTGGRHWRMGAAARRRVGLPAKLNTKVYGIMDALTRVDEDAGVWHHGRADPVDEALLGGAG
ncbi:trihelix transcription factor ASR3 [Hordeum vulgare]|nr:trihelix transcription factor ASR3 [Hordeum vulgare]